jgi:dihydroflavonol-4-reductase
MSSTTLLVTGATGLAGANICLQGVGRGYRVRALVRNEADAEQLRKIGAELAIGDITNADSLVAAMRGVTHVVNCAAVLGGTWSTASAEQIIAANRDGAINVLAAAERNGVERTIMFSSVAMCDWNQTLTEMSPIMPIGTAASPYAHAKVATYYESMARAARGQWVATVIPGGIYGPSPVIDRALAATSVNASLIEAATGVLKRYVPIKMPWVFSRDVADVALNALERGQSGARYLASGRIEDAGFFVAFHNRFAEMAQSPHRVDEFDPTAPGAEDDKDFGNMIRYVLQPKPEPLFDASFTNRELGHDPVSAEQGLADTLAWLRANQRM